jgi:hypothetical protein
VLARPGRWEKEGKEDERDMVGLTIALDPVKFFSSSLGCSKRVDSFS